MKFLSYFFFLLGFLSIFLNISHPIGLSGKSIQYYETIEMRFFVGIIQISVGVLVYFYSVKLVKKDFIEFSKCKKCKKSYNYAELKKGICPKCNIETIEIEEYYKKYPNELKDV